MITVHEQQGPDNAYTMWSGTTEAEGFDRFHLKLPGSQEEIIKVCPLSWLGLPSDCKTLALTLDAAK